MAQKSLKTLAARNTAALNRTHLISLSLNALFLLLRTIFLSRGVKLYILCSLPALAIEFWFERIGRPTYASASSSSSGVAELKRAGEDLEAKGLTEWMWDLLYWTWGCLVAVILFGDRGWWLYLVVPAYSVWLAVATFMGVRKGFGGLIGGAAQDQAMGGEGSTTGTSKRQAKIEKRGQKVTYR